MAEEDLHRRFAQDGLDSLFLHEILVFLVTKQELGASVSDLLVSWLGLIEFILYFSTRVLNQEYYLQDLW